MTERTLRRLEVAGAIAALAANIIVLFVAPRQVQVVLLLIVIAAHLVKELVIAFLRRSLRAGGEGPAPGVGTGA